MKERTIRRIIAYLGLTTILLYILTGYGITQFRIIESITFGLLTKPSSFKMHSILIYPLIITVGAHIYLSCWSRWKK